MKTMQKVIAVGALFVLLCVVLYAAAQVSGPNQYAARIAEAQADLETARALRDQAQAIQTIAGGLNRVAFGQTVILIVLALAGVGLVGFVVYARFYLTPHPPLPNAERGRKSMPLGQAPVAGLPDGLQGIDPALVNQFIQFEMLRAIRAMSAPQTARPQLPEDLHHKGHEGR